VRRGRRNLQSGGAQFTCLIQEFLWEIKVKGSGQLCVFLNSPEILFILTGICKLHVVTGQQSDNGTKNDSII
jgi:hypothetical protein